jgi:hypothetical protein
MIMSQISTATGRLTRASSRPPIAWNGAGNKMPEGHARGDAGEHPHRQVALECSHGIARGALAGGFTLGAHASSLLSLRAIIFSPPIRPSTRL